MKKIDLHVHSKYSEHPSEWFLQRIGAKESYTEPELIYQLALSHGMDFVTITDHNKIDGALLLQQAHPENVIIGMETTAYFPEDECKVHILVYGIDEQQYADIQKARNNIYELRNYLKQSDIAYSVAHATFSVNNKLTVAHIEKLILLFDVFEGINGGRSYLFNAQWMHILKNLTESHIIKLCGKHRIKPISNTPWIKAFTGGSDDHAGLFVGNTYTVLPGSTPTEIIENIRNKKSCPDGRHNDYKTLAFAVYKVVCDYAKVNRKSSSYSLLYEISGKIFESNSFSLTDRYKIRQLKTQSQMNEDIIGILLAEIIEELRAIELTDVQKRLDLVFYKIADIVDEFLKRLLLSLKNDILNADIIALFMNVSSSMAGLFISLPFFSSVKHLNQNRDLMKEIYDALGMKPEHSEQKVLWFTDRNPDIDRLYSEMKVFEPESPPFSHDIQFVTVSSHGSNNVSSNNIIHLPAFFSFEISPGNFLTLEFPSVLKSLEVLCKHSPTEIRISTPGPVGCLGLLLGKLLGIKCVGIFHEDYEHLANKMIDDDSITEMFSAYLRWFYGQMDMLFLGPKQQAPLLDKVENIMEVAG